MRNRGVFATALVAMLMCGLFGTGHAWAKQVQPAPAVPSTIHRYKIPPITLLDQHGRLVRLDQVLAGSKPVLLQFFFTTCTTICGVRSAQLVYVAPKLAAAGVHIDFYSISIDPDQDTSGHMLAYSKQFGIDPPSNWHLLTGSETQIRLVQAAFDASDPSADRMMHRPLTFIRGGANQPWTRIDSMLSTHELMQEIEAATASAR